MRRIATLLVATAALWSVLAGSSRADVFDDNPATASRGPDDAWVFIRADDGAILARHWTGSGWSAWESLEGDTTSGPAAVAYGGTVHVFVRGPDGGTYQSFLQADGSWHGWQSLGGYSTSAPGVSVRRGANYLDLVVKGGDSQLYQQSYVPGAGWSGFAPIGGVLTSAATVNSQSPGLLNIWSRALDGSAAQKSWTGTAWTDWGTIGGGIIGAPTSISRVENVINVYVRGAGDVLFQDSWSPAGWTGWIALDSTAMRSSPAAGSDGPNREWLFARKGRNELMYKEWTAGGGWAGWTGMGTIALPPPPPPPPDPSPPAPQTPDGELNVETGIRCTPAGGRLRVNLAVKKAKGKNKARVTRIVFYTKGKGRKVRVDRKAPFVVRIQINRPAGTTGRVYARVYYKRSARGKTHRKTVSRRYTVCR